MASVAGSGGTGTGGGGRTGGGGGAALPRAAPQLVQKRASGDSGDPQVAQNPPDAPLGASGIPGDDGGWSVMRAFLLLRGRNSVIDT